MPDDSRNRLAHALVRVLDTGALRKVLSDDRVMGVLVGLIGARGRIRKATRSRISTIARGLRLATEGDVRELRRAVDALGDAVAKIEASAKGDGDRAASGEKPTN